MVRPPLKLAKDICRVLFEATRNKRPPYWVSVDTIVRKLGISQDQKVDRAILYAADRRWLGFDRVPPSNLCISIGGVTIVQGKRK